MACRVSNELERFGGWSLPPKLCLAVIFVGGCLAGSDARGLGQWKSNDPRLSQWFRGLMQPDTIPPVSCCGEADAYWADQVRVGPDGEVIATITAIEANARGCR
jgi:hypothetical protein